MNGSVSEYIYDRLGCVWIWSNKKGHRIDIPLETKDTLVDNDLAALDPFIFIVLDASYS